MLRNIFSRLEECGSRNAFLFGEQYYTYDELRIEVIAYQKVINSVSDNSNVGVVTNYDLKTYASILSIFLSGRTFVPLNPALPDDRLIQVINQADVGIILDSEHHSFFEIKYPEKRADQPQILSEDNLNFKQADGNLNAYIFFTSGSTGVPKGVPITYLNLDSFLAAFFRIGYELNENDRFLQMFDLTFDLSLMSYLAPMCLGATCYPVSPEGIKYNNIYKLLEDYEISFSLMVPSILTHLRPYFDEIHLQSMKYCLFCGEALRSELVKDWQKCIPSAKIENVYGPTEATIFCLRYPCNPAELKSYNGIVCIGKPMEGMNAAIIGEDGMDAIRGEKGELGLYGSQVTAGYWKNEKKNQEAFIYSPLGSIYKTGDLCYLDDEGDYYYCGRTDHQVKIQGYRVELGEIEFFSSSFLDKKLSVAIVDENPEGISIYLFVEKNDAQLSDLERFLRTKLPDYMIPKKLIVLNEFPLNINGKIDRNKLKSLIRAN
ncbi:MAG: AMP-binding protein [Chitinophagales bacterium]